MFSVRKILLCLLCLLSRLRKEVLLWFVFLAAFKNVLDTAPLLHGREIDSAALLREQFYSAAPPAAGLLLSVPFYVFEDVIPANFTLADRTDLHDDDYWFWKASLKHPMRTHDPAEAKIFVVPLLLNRFEELNRYPSRNRNHSMHFQGNMEAVQSAFDRLAPDKTFQKYFFGHSERFIAVRSHWHRSKKNTIVDKMVQKMNLVAFENHKTNNDPNRLSFPSTYVGNGCPMVPFEEKTEDLVFVGSPYGSSSRIWARGDGDPFRDRRVFCDLLQNKQSTGVPAGNNLRRTTKRITAPACGHGTDCPWLGEARLGFHFRGDTPGASRLANLVLSGTIPLFTRREQFDVLPPWFDWEKISFFFDVSRFDDDPGIILDNEAIWNMYTSTRENATEVQELNATNRDRALQELRAILDDEEALKAKHRVLLAHRKLFDWTTLYPFDTYMYMLQAYLYPDTRRSRSPYGALILPPPVGRSEGVTVPTKNQPSNDPFYSALLGGDASRYLSVGSDESRNLTVHRTE